MEGVTIVMPITYAKDKAQRRLEMKARSTLMLGIPNEHQLKFNSIKDAKLLLEAVEKRFWLQNLMSQLELLDEKLSQEDVNQKLLRSLPPEWNTHAVVWRNKVELETMSMNDIYNNLKVSSKVVNAAHGVTTASTQVNTAYSINIDNLSDDCRAPRNQDNKNKESSRRSVPIETSTSTALVSCDGLGGYDWSDQAEEGLNYALITHLQVLTQSLDKLIECQIVDNCKKDEFVNESVVENSKAMFSEEEPKVVRKNDDAPIIKEWVSDSDEENVSQTKTKKKTVKPSIAKIEFVKPKQQEKTARKTVKQVEKHSTTLTVQETIKEIGTI
ncbi:hypothetical protein Tco_0319889 [Tanacetum coccineum]